MWQQVGAGVGLGGDRIDKLAVGAAAVKGEWGPHLEGSRRSWFRTSGHSIISCRKGHLPGFQGKFCPRQL